jgi:predicted metal-dependent phosphoesterase TrpH
MRAMQPRVGRADLHVHTTFSDGQLPPATVVEKAAELGLVAVGITDHDAIGGVSEALARGTEIGIVVVPGVEISAGIDFQEIHILGYFMDHADEVLQKRLIEFQSARVDRILGMLERLKSLGIVIDADRVFTLSGEGAVGRPHIAKALLEEGYVGSIEEAFQTLIGDKGPAYVPRRRVSPEDAMKIIHAAGGVAGWAHPGLEGHDEWIDEFITLGLDFLEVVHPEHSPVETREYEAMAQQKGLIATGGSDCHGFRIDGKLALGRYTVESSIIDRLQERSQQVRARHW